MVIVVVSKSPPTMKITGYIFIPPSSPIWKLEVVRTDGTLDDVTSYAKDGTQISYGTTGTTGVFTLKIENSSGKFTNAWVAGNTVNIYKDYGSVATTKRFKGKIDRVSGSLTDQYLLTLTGRVSYANLREINVTKSYLNIETSAIIEDLFLNYANSYDRTDTSIFKTTNTNQTVSFSSLPFWDCVVQVAVNGEMDIYIDPFDKVHLIQQNSVTNTTDAIVEGQNLIEVGEFGDQTDEVKNKITIYGAEINGVPLLWTAEDTTSESLYGIKEYTESNTNLNTIADVQAYANFVLSQKKDPPSIGKVTSYILATLQPAELLKISNQINGFKGAYRIVSFTDYFPHTDIPSTEVTVNKDPLLVSKIFKSTFSGQQALQDLKNKFDMKYSYSLVFTSDSGTHSNTAINNGVLYWTGSGVNGVWASPVSNTSSNVSSIELKASGNNIQGNIVFEVSVDNGISWNIVLKDTNYSNLGIGTQLKLRVTINNVSANIASISVLYK